MPPETIDEITEIQTKPISEYDIEPLTYNDQTQVSYEMRIVGTRSLRNSWTRAKNGNDRKYEIDDSKSVR